LIRNFLKFSIKTLAAACLLFSNAAFGADAKASGYLEVSGWPAPQGNIAGYHLYMSDQPSAGYKKININPVTSTAFTVSGVEVGKTYYFVITQVTKDGVQSRPSQPFTKVAGAAPSPQTVPTTEAPMVVKPKRRMWGEPLAPGQSEDLVQWMKESDALELSKQTGKPLLYDFMAAWCGPCKMMAREVFNNPEQAKWINQEFLAVRIQDLRREQRVNPLRTQSLQKQYHIGGFPTLVVALPDKRFDSNLQASAGYGGIDYTRQFLDSALSVLKTKK
jgi:thiol-disulfide isomerase/thioredoxin